MPAHAAEGTVIEEDAAPCLPEAAIAALDLSNALKSAATNGRAASCPVASLAPSATALHVAVSAGASSSADSQKSPPRMPGGFVELPDPQAPTPFPFKLLPLDDATQRKIVADFAGYPNGLQQVLSWGFKVSGTATEADFQAVLNQPLREGDIWVCSPPKCGSMWTQELVWLLENELDFDGCQAMLTERWRFSESRLATDLDQRQKLNAQLAAEKAAQAATPPPPRLTTSTPCRFVKSHLPMSLRPPRLLETCRVIYVARNPKDICVSFFRHARRYKNVGFRGGFDAFLEHFMAGNVTMTPVVPHMVEAWNLRHHPNVCFVFYEDLKCDLRGQIRRIAAFLGRSFSDQDVNRLAEYLHIDNFKKNPWRLEDFGKKWGVVNEGEGDFVRKGKVGDWRNYFSQEMSDRMDRWLEEQLRGTDLRFTTELPEQD